VFIVTLHAIFIYTRQNVIYRPLKKSGKIYHGFGGVNILI